MKVLNSILLILSIITLFVTGCLEPSKVAEISTVEEGAGISQIESTSQRKMDGKIIAQKKKVPRRQISARLIARRPALSVEISPDNKRVAYVVPTDTLVKRVYLVVDRKPGEEFDEARRQYDTVDFLTFSPNSQRFACVIGELDRKIRNIVLLKINYKYFVVVDGMKMTPPLDSVGFITFTPDSQKLVYVAKESGKWFAGALLIKGSAEYIKLPPIASLGQYEDIDSIIFSRDYNRVMAYSAKEGKKWLLVVDGKEGKKYDGIKEITFSRDGKRVAYVAMVGSKRKRSMFTNQNEQQKQSEFVVVDGKEQKPYDSISADGIIFSPDGERVVYSAKEGKKWLLVVDGKEGKKYDGIKEITFSPDSKHLFYDAREGNNWLVVTDEKEEKLPNLRGGKSYVVPFVKMDGKEVKLYWKIDEGHFVRVDGKEIKLYDDIRIPFSFSPNGEMFYAAKKGQKWLLVVDGEERKSYDDIGIPGFSPSGKKMVYAAKEGQKWLLVVDEKEKEPYCRYFSSTRIKRIGRIFFDSEDNIHYLCYNEYGIYLIEEKIGLPDTLITEETDTNTSSPPIDSTIDPKIESLIKRLEKGLENEDSNRLIRAARQLSKLGVSANPAVPVLKKVLYYNKSERAYNATAKALKQIGTPEALKALQENESSWFFY